MAEQQIILTIDEDGIITAKTQGFQGEACIEAVDEIFEEGLNITCVKATDEYYQQPNIQQRKVITQKRGAR